ncbi:MAG: hypothetical protein A3B90_02560 [Candidatus Magasanikbacteria bacterium RIFCSPHIGHO2_02_FULL_41_13]|uniref:Uncharacterized protein n=1 Tax=Candidatus Magasanikbacteria bacterium RIFCSPHIGHO2_02_FULL_41_13 TaxID=1798676 RepID=A0A1F6M3K6_9BACT|nr:MAG: hypothetical protein A3B90_02560 [Candidatus Magasanikbacteria bacterium RIFCSPHIGHO2_02_FULL_41_13]
MSYIFIFIVFLVLVFFVQKFNKNTVQIGAKNASTKNPLRDFAASLGLQFEEFSPGSNKNTLYSVGSRAWGEYAGIPIEIVYATRTDMGIIGISYSYSMEKTITFTIKNTTKKYFDILPKNSAAESHTSGNSRFDESLMLVGDAIIPSDILDYFARLGWMHLTLRENKLTFHDTFYDQFKGMSGSMQIMNTVHPIWKSSASNWDMDQQSGKYFLDTLVDLAKRSKLL